MNPSHLENLTKMHYVGPILQPYEYLHVQKYNGPYLISLLSIFSSSGVPVNFDIEGCMLEEVTLLTAGQLQARVSWGVDSLGNPLIPVMSNAQTSLRFVVYLFIDF